MGAALGANLPCIGRSIEFEGDAVQKTEDPGKFREDVDPLQLKRQFIANVRLFKRLSEAEHPAIATALDERWVLQGAVIIRQGTEGDELFVIKQGTCSVEIDGVTVARLQVGDYFGETALLHDEPRSATIRATSEVNLLTINRARFQELGLHHKLEFHKRDAVAGGAASSVQAEPPSEKTAEEEQLMVRALKSNKNLETMVPLDDGGIKEMIDLMWREAVPEGHEIIKQGDLNADYFYIILSGSFEVQVDGQSTVDGDSSAASLLLRGQSFGELALMYFAPRAATIIARTDAEVMIIDRPQFKKILAAASLQSAKQYIQHLDKVDLLSALKDEEKIDLARALTEMSFSQDEHIFDQGEKGDLFYILIDGSVSVVKDGSEVAKLTATPQEVQFFGERALLTNEPRSATVQVTSESATALVVDKVSFDMLLGPLEQLRKRGREGTAAVEKVGMDCESVDQARFGKIPKKELQKLAMLGAGGFGTVDLVLHTKTGDTYALKTLSKGYIVKSGMQASVVSEKNVQLMCDSPFVVRLYETYSSLMSLYFLLELALGGELYNTYNNKNLWGREDCAKFYVAGTTFAFEHMHSKKIIFRDLKPENLLLTGTGHVKLTDMGLAKVVVGKTYTTCGTPDYFAPELISSSGHNHAVDWWCLGILMFELLGRHPPFESGTPMLTYKKVTKGIDIVRFPKQCRGDAESLIKGLLCAHPSERLPMKKGDVSNIKDHPWYSGFNWDAMFDLSMTPPYLPTVRSNQDASNFSANREDAPPVLPYSDDRTGWDTGFATCSD